MIKVSRSQVYFSDSYERLKNGIELHETHLSTEHAMRLEVSNATSHEGIIPF